jgi:hypothetical protein
MSLFKTLYAIDCSEHTEKKGRFTYLSWTWAWSILKQHAPDATFEKHIFDGIPFMVDSAGYAYVMVTVTASGESATEVYPVLNHSNKPVQNPSSFDVNSALQRCLVKAIAFLGLGIYIFSGEDLPDVSHETPPTSRIAPISKKEEDLRYLEELVRARGHKFDEVISRAEAKGTSIKQVIAAYEELNK